MKLYCCILFLLMARLAAFGADAPKLLPFQGRLTDQNGLAVGDGVRLVQFKIYDAPVGGQAVWNGEVQKLTVNGGLVSTVLGSKASLSSVDFNRSLYLEVTIDANSDNQITAADPPMLPRQAILPAVFAKESANSRLLAGYDWSALFAQGVTNPSTARIAGNRLIDASVGAAQIVPKSVTAAQIGDATVTSTQVAPGSITRDRLDPSLIIDSIIPPGTIQAFGGVDTPPGWLLCDGRATNSAQFPRLYAAISTNWGAGIQGSTNDFNLPDLRGRFVRGRDGGAGNDPDRGSRQAGPAGGNGGDAIGSLQADAFASHRHQMSSQNNTGDFANVGGVGAGAVAQGAFVAPAGGSETRPKNAYVNYIIKY